MLIEPVVDVPIAPTVDVPESAVGAEGEWLQSILLRDLTLRLGLSNPATEVIPTNHPAQNGGETTAMETRNKQAGE